MFSPQHLGRRLSAYPRTSRSIRARWTLELVTTLKLPVPDVERRSCSARRRRGDAEGGAPSRHGPRRRHERNASERLYRRDEPATVIPGPRTPPSATSWLPVPFLTSREASTADGAEFSRARSGRTCRSTARVRWREAVAAYSAAVFPSGGASRHFPGHSLGSRDVEKWRGPPPDFDRAESVYVAQAPGGPPRAPPFCCGRSSGLGPMPEASMPRQTRHTTLLPEASAYRIELRAGRAHGGLFGGAVQFEVSECLGVPRRLGRRTAAASSHAPRRITARAADENPAAKSYSCAATYTRARGPRATWCSRPDVWDQDGSRRAACADVYWRAGSPFLAEAEALAG